MCKFEERSRRGEEWLNKLCNLLDKDGIEYDITGHEYVPGCHKFTPDLKLKSGPHLDAKSSTGVERECHEHYNSLRDGVYLAFEGMYPTVLNNDCLVFIPADRCLWARPMALRWWLAANNIDFNFIIDDGVWFNLRKLPDEIYHTARRILRNSGCTFAYIDKGKSERVNIHALVQA